MEYPQNSSDIKHNIDDIEMIGIKKIEGKYSYEDALEITGK